MNKFGQIALALLPLLITPLLFFALAEGVLNLGGGEKDIILAFFWAIWAIAFAFSAFVLMFRDWTIGRWARRSALVATGALLVLWLLTFAASLSGLL